MRKSHYQVPYRDERRRPPPSTKSGCSTTPITGLVRGDGAMTVRSLLMGLSQIAAGRCQLNRAMLPFLCLQRGSVWNGLLVLDAGNCRIGAFSCPCVALHGTVAL